MSEENLSALDVAELYNIALDVKFACGGMMVVVEPEGKGEQQALSAEQLSAALLELAKKRAAKKKVKKGYAPGREARQHVSTARILKRL